MSGASKRQGELFIGNRKQQFTLHAVTALTHRKSSSPKKKRIPSDSFQIVCVFFLLFFAHRSPFFYIYIYHVFGFSVSILRMQQGRDSDIAWQQPTIPTSHYCLVEFVENYRVCPYMYFVWQPSCVP